MFNLKNLRNNIAIITLEQSIEFNDHVQAIALPRYGIGMPFVFEEGITTGFGLIGADEAIYSARLLRSFHRVLTNSECTIRFPHMNGQMAQHFCVRDHLRVNNICDGDQGSVFTVLERGIWTAVIRTHSTVCLFLI